MILHITARLQGVQVSLCQGSKTDIIFWCEYKNATGESSEAKCEPLL